jgi:hypothetical protein
MLTPRRDRARRNTNARTGVFRRSVTTTEDRVGPSIVAVQHAAQVFADPAVRTQVRTWFDEGTPLLEMVDRLGIADFFDPELRVAIAGLSPEAVTMIRDAFVAEIDRAGASTSATLPVECEITRVTGPVTVTPAQSGGRQVVRVVDGS